MILPPLLLLIMLAMMKFVSLFGQQYTLICSHPRPLQRIFFPYVGLDAHITCMRFRPACSRSRKKRAAALCPLCFYPKLPAKLAFAPYPLGFKFGYCILENKQSESTDHPIEVPLSSRGIQPFFQPRGPQHHTDESTQFFTRARLEGTELLGMIGPRPTLKSYDFTLDGSGGMMNTAARD